MGGFHNISIDTDGWMSRWIDEYVEQWIGGWMSRWIDEYVEQWIGGWINM